MLIIHRRRSCSKCDGSDGCAMKSGRDAEGRKRNAPTENGIIRNNIVYRAHGGFVIGSEMSGGARNLYVSNCTFMGTDIGLRFKTTRGRGGVVENIYCTDIAMTNIPSEAILFDMYYNGRDFSESEGNPVIEAKPVSEETPQFKSIFIRNMSNRKWRNVDFAGTKPWLSPLSLGLGRRSLHCSLLSRNE